MIGHAELDMHAEGENVLLLQLSALANNRKQTKKGQSQRSIEAHFHHVKKIRVHQKVAIMR